MEFELFMSRREYMTDALKFLEDGSVEVEVKNKYLKEIFDKIEFSRDNGLVFILDVYLK